MIVAGLMSGTSADSIDVAFAAIDGKPAPGGDLRVQSLGFAAVPWPAAARALIFDLFAGRASPAALCRANFVLGEHFAAALLQAATELGIDLATVDLVGSHGQTIWHDVAGGRVTSTLQIGEPAVIAERTGVTTVANFRVADVAAGGQGAPLVSIFDWLLLRPPARLNGVPGGWRAIQNIGGIGNVTLLPPVGSDAQPLAFDTGPGNVLIDWFARFATDGRLTYDHDGLLAQQGQVDEALLARWLAHDYFRQPPPKTTGRELFSGELATAWYADAVAAGRCAEDGVATATAFTAATITDAYARFAPGPLAQVAVAGGGARNPVLMAALQVQLARTLGHPVELCTHAALGFAAEAKEALTFALLAYLCVRGLPGNVPSCTGAAGERVLGQIAVGRNWRRVTGDR